MSSATPPYIAIIIPFKHTNPFFKGLEADDRDAWADSFVIYLSLAQLAKRLPADYDYNKYILSVNGTSVLKESVPRVGFEPTSQT